MERGSRLETHAVSRRFVLVDRDGTINEEISPEYVLEPDQIRLLPGAARALRELREIGLGVVVVTNQSPVGRGWITADQLDTIHARLSELLHAEGAAVDGFYVCPHVPGDGCDCRKPEVGLALRAAAEHGFDPAEAFVVGDHPGDVEMGRRIGAGTFQVRTGHGMEEIAEGGPPADHVVQDLAEAARIIRAEVLAGAGR
ncbi:MAG TPA: HAD family hydrolase [Actinomycetota bacterium]|nr:HAD family hydrolase [Actinomycetota bacterium]